MRIAVIQLLGLTSNQIKNIPQKSKVALESAIKDIRLNSKTVRNEGMKDILSDFMNKCDDIDLDYFVYGDYNYSNALNVAHDTYSKTFPTIQDFINYCHAQKITVFDFQDFWNYFDSWLPELKHTSHHKYLTSKIQVNQFPFDMPTGKIGFKKVLYMSWLSERVPLHPINFVSFAYLVDKNEKKVLDDKCGLPKFIFNPNGW